MNDYEAIPFLDLVTPHRELEVELLEVARRTLRSAAFIGGDMLQRFEQEFADFCDAMCCVGVSSGTDALRFALMAAGVGPGDSVITVPNSFIATSEAVSQAGATPEFIDVNERTYTMDPEKLWYFAENGCEKNKDGRLVSKRTGKLVKAILPVHLFGQMADMDPICEIAARHRLVVIEDACQAHGASYFSRNDNRWYRAGSMGAIAAFSFYPGKNLGACGEAGAITTNYPKLADVCRQLRDHGQAKKYYHNMEGYNGRLDAMQAGFLNAKLKHLPQWNTQRREAAARYNELFLKASSKVVVPFEPSWSNAVYHLYVVRCANRERVRQDLERQKIGTGIHYPIPLHLQKAYQHLGYKPGEFPVTEKAAEEILSLPMFPTITKAQQQRVVEQLTQSVRAQVELTTAAQKH